MDRRKALKNTALLVGVTLSSGTLTSMLQSCQSQNRLDWTPQFFTPEQAEVVSEIAEMILPRTETPSAKDLKVDIFVDLMFKETLSPEDQKHVLEGYEKFAATCEALHGTTFLNMSAEKRVEVLKKVGEDTNTFVPTVWGSKLEAQPPLDFYRRVKQFTLTGYFTSEEIGKNHLRFDPIPGGYNGCLPYNGKNIWTI